MYIHTYIFIHTHACIHTYLNTYVNRCTHKSITHTRIYAHLHRAVSEADRMAPIIEAGPNDDGSMDPWTKKENEKKEKLDKQKKQ
jgi:hypothetical protein